MGDIGANLETARLLEGYERPLIRNAWYCAAWSHEVTQEMFPRRILDMPIVLYRTQAGKAVALLDICPHKLAPMSQGKKVGDNLQCGYHGLEFDCSGACVRNPQGDGRIPQGAQLRSFPLLERYGVLWIWTGDPALADERKIIDLSHFEDPAWRTIKGGHHVACNYMLLVENLLDLGHALFLHKTSGGMSDGLVLSETSIEQEGDTLRDLRLYRDARPPATIFGKYAPKGVRLDYNADMLWVAPSMLMSHNGCSESGRARDGSGLSLRGTHLLTPETQHTMHYFYGTSRNYALDDPDIDEAYRRFQRDALQAEDSRVSEAIDELLPETVALGVRMVTLSTDVSGRRVNRMLDRMAEAER
jgi:phenylpropionate dioxygenase-like ring-hydroxylating dioxygenase large terminal subunit